MSEDSSRAKPRDAQRLPVHSMTGFARASGSDGRLSVTLELRSVNHRHLHFKGRVPPGFGKLEDLVEKRLRAALSRGTISYSLDWSQVPGTEGPRFSEANLRRVLAELKGLADGLNLPFEPELQSLLSMPGMQARSDELPTFEALVPVVDEVFEEALTAFLAARAREGEALRGELLGQVSDLVKQMKLFAERQPDAHAAYRDRLKTRMEEFLKDKGLEIQDAELLREVALYAEKSDVEEEQARMRAHIAELERILETGGTVGRSLEFLLQEMQREINTMGSKSLDAELAHRVVEIKGVLERMREQVANLE